MTNHIVYFKKPGDLWALWLIIYDFEKVRQCSTFPINHITEQVFLANEKLEVNMPQIFKIKFILSIRKYRSTKKSLHLVEQKLVKLNKIEETAELIAEY